MTSFLRPVFLWIGLLTIPGSAPAAPDAATYFTDNCAPCHTLAQGGDLDLAGVPARRDHAWLLRFIRDPEGVIGSGDPTAAELVRKYGGMIMPSPPDMTDEMAQALVRYIEQQTAAAPAGAGASASIAPPVDDRPFTADDVATGRALFTGARRLTGRAAPCAACHHAGDVVPFAGGTVGPDLTRVHARLRGRQGLTTWLGAPPTPVMRAIYRGSPLSSDERRALVAYLEHTAAQPLSSAAPYSVIWQWLGLGGAAVGLLVIGLVWSRRFRSVRAPLVSETLVRPPPPGRTAPGSCGDRR